jgi:predicted RNA-binding protein YlqC (UPF0109 family)
VSFSTSIYLYGGNEMKELVEVIAKSLVDHPDEVVVTEKETEKAIVVELKVASDDMGKVIGKQGRIAKSIRTVVKAAATKDDKKVVVEILQ